MSVPQAPSTTTTTEVVLPGVVEPHGVRLRQRDLAPLARGEALVRVLATGVSYAENSMRRNRYPGQPKFPFVPGYDLVGDVVAVGPGADAGLVGRRVAAVTKTGGWASLVALDARDLLVVPADVAPADVETVLLTGLTAWQMLHRSARVRTGQTILVHGASGGVGSLLVEMARDAGIRVVGTGSERSHEMLRGLGAEPLDYRDPQLVERLAALAPDGFDAIFDNIGGTSFARSFAQLAPGGTLVGYGNNSQIDGSGSQVIMFAGVLGRFAAWTLSPNRGRRATFYNFWAGKHVRPARFRARLREDLDAILDLVAAGKLGVRIAARFPLQRAGDALALADGRSPYGKVVLEPALG
jgi:NADPH:quinone reductase-like Zn-dependent oxidoreductase